MSRPILFALTASLLLASACSAPADTSNAPPPAAEPAVQQSAPAAATPTVDPALDAWMRDYAREGSMALRYALATTTGPDPLTLVYLVGGDYCGSGGCTLLVLHKTGDAFEQLGRLTVTQTPIRALESQTHGRPDLAVSVRGGGAGSHEALIPFDGRRYASNPTVAPARPIEGDAPGQTLITDDTPKVTVRAE